MGVAHKKEVAMEKAAKEITPAEEIKVTIEETVKEDRGS